MSEITGLGVQIRVDSLSSFDWNDCPDCVEYTAFANFGKLRFKTEHEQQIWQECSRLITNCIIYYNATILSNLLAHRTSIGDLEGVAQLKKISLVAWQHINLHGRYEFTKAQDVIDMQAILQELLKKSLKEKLVV